MTDTTFDAHEAARQVVLSSTEDIDYCGIGEQFGDDWSEEGLNPVEWDIRQRQVADLATSATVTVTWPEDGAPDQCDAAADELATELANARTELQRQDAEITRLRALCAAVAKDSRERKAEADGRRQHNQRLEDELATRTAQLELQRAALENLQAERDQALVDLETAKGWRDAAIVERDQLRREARDYRRANTSFQEINTIRTAERDQLKAENEQLRERVESAESLAATAMETVGRLQREERTTEQLRAQQEARAEQAETERDQAFTERDLFKVAAQAETRAANQWTAEVKVASLLHDMATVARHIEDGAYSDADETARQALGIAPGVDLPGR